MTVGTRLILLSSAAFLVAFQVRFSIETKEARDTFLYIPFALRPCTNVIEEVEHPARDVLHRGDELIAVNGRSYAGMSVYRQELRAARRYLDAARLLPPKELDEAYSKWPLRVTVRSGAAAPLTADVNFANCTCGSLSTFQVVWYCILPPAVAILLGLLVAASRPQSALAWLFLAVSVCAAQVAIVPEFSSHWSQVANPLEWRDWFRVPALVYQAFFSTSWPAWLLLFAMYCFREDVNPLPAWWAVSPMLAVAALKALVAVGLSEDFRAVAPLHHVLDAASTEMSVALFTCAALATWSFGWRWVLVTTTIAMVAAVSLYWPVSAPTSYVIWSYSNKVEIVLPTFHRTPEVVNAIFSVALLLAVMVAAWKKLSANTCSSAAGLTVLSLILLLMPFVYAALSTEWALWWPQLIPQGVVVSFYLGLLGLSWFAMRLAKQKTTEQAKPAA